MGDAVVCVRGATLHGCEALPVSVEVSLSGGLPGIDIVGMPDVAVLEARARIRCSLRASGFTLPRMHVTVNLAPADLRKHGTSLDLPIAVGILAVTQQISDANLKHTLFAGELALDGHINPIRGLVAYQLLARDLSLELLGSIDCVHGCVGDVVCRHLSTLGDLTKGVSAAQARQKTAAHPVLSRACSLDFADVVDQDFAKEALVIAACGGHGIIMIGPPGTGKSMLAKRLSTILPPLDDRRWAEALLVHSVAGEALDAIENGERPFRAPHHSVSMSGLIGGGRPVVPGEISLAHGGVLFLDELPEFANNALQALRQPLEDKRVNLVRADGSYAFPCDFQLVAAANPCPCGHLGDTTHSCRCTDADIARYHKKIRGPLMDRIDLSVDVVRPKTNKVLRGMDGLSSDAMRKQVERGCAFRKQRLKKSTDDALSSEARTTLEHVAERMSLGGRGVVRVRRVSRTIADLAEHEMVMREDVLKACSMRMRDTV